MLAAAVVIIAAWATGVASAAAARQHNPKGKFLGVVQAGRSHAKASPQAPLAASNLTYHGGPVMHTNRTHVIYWEPSGFSTTSTYKTLINTYLADVAADSGKHSNVYASDVQYTDGSGNAAYNSTFAGSIVATDPYPASGCTDTVAGTSVCLSDAQIQAEVDHVVAANGLPRGLGDLYFLMTPQGVGSCFGSGPSSCAYTDYCAYHSDFDFGAGETLYANQPYAGDPGCDSGEQPNGDVADSTINLISHEHNEAITDPEFENGAWYDSSGNENGDKCAWNFGTALGGSSGSQYNQLINSGHYYLQQEWSNASHGCVLTMTNNAPTASFTSSPSSPNTGQPVSFDGSASSDSDGTITSYSWTFGDGATATGAKPTHAYATAASYPVKLTVTDNDGVTASITHTVTVGGSANAPPSASFTFAPGSPTTGQSVSFDGSGSSDSDGTITSYGWDFGDGATGSGETTSHTYENAGTYTARLTVTDNDGSTSHVDHQVTVAQASSGAPPVGGTTTGGGSTAGGVSPVFASPTLPSAGLTAPPPRARVLIPSQRLILSSSRATTVRVTCSSRVRCAGTLRIYVVMPASAPSRSRSRTVLLGTARFSIAARHSVTVRLRLVRLASTLLRDHVHVRVRTRAVVMQAAAGSAAVERSVWLERAPKPKR